MLTYNICNNANKDIFEKQCAALEKHIPALKKGKYLMDVDLSELQEYDLNGKKIIVKNDLYVGAVYTSSEIDINPFFGKNK